MPGFIDPKLTVTDDHRAVIDSYGFELKPAGGKDLVVVIDSKVTVDGGKTSRYVGKNVTDLLHKAVGARSVFEEKNLPTGSCIDAASDAADRAGDEEDDDDSPIAGLDEGDPLHFEDGLLGDDTFGEYGEPDELDLIDETESNTNAHNARTRDLTNDDAMHNKRDEPRPAASSSRGSHVNDVSTSRRARTPKYDNRFRRGFELIANNPAITYKEIMVKANLSTGMSRGIILAWNMAVAVLEEHGALSSRAAEKLVNTSKK